MEQTRMRRCLGSLGTPGWREGAERGSQPVGAQPASSEPSTLGPDICFLLTCAGLSVCCCFVVQIWVRVRRPCPTPEQLSPPWPSKCTARGWEKRGEAKRTCSDGHGVGVTAFGASVLCPSLEVPGWWRAERGNSSSS